MIRFFRSPQPAALFVIPFIVIVLWIQKGGSMTVYEGSNLTPLWVAIRPVFQVLPSWLLLIVMVALVSTTAIYLNLMMNRHEVLYKNSYLPSLIYVLLSSAFLDFLMVHPFHVVNLLLIRVWDKAFSLFKNDRPVRALFDSGFILSVAVLFYLPLYPFLFLYFIALAILRPFNFREWLITLIGVLLPFFFQLVWWFPGTLFEKWHWINRYIAHYRIAPLLLPDRATWIPAGMIIFLLLVSLVKLRAHYYKNIIRTRSYQQILIVHFLTAAGVYLLAANRTFPLLLLCMFPAAVFVSYYFVSAKKRMWWYEGLLWGLIVAVVWARVSF